MSVMKKECYEKECRLNGYAKIARIQTVVEGVVVMCTSDLSTSHHTRLELGMLDGGWAPPYHSHGC